MTKQKMEEIRSAVLTLASLSNEEWEELCALSVTKRKNAQNVFYKNKEEQITSTINKFGIQVNVKGFTYLRSAIIYCMKSKKSVSMTKELYPAIADEFDDTPSRVERAIRHAIDTAWNKTKNWDIYTEVFGEEPWYLDKKPKNGEFIAGISEYLKKK